MASLVADLADVDLDGGRLATAQRAEPVSFEGFREGRRAHHVGIKEGEMDPGGKLALPGRDPCPRNPQGGEIRGGQSYGRSLPSGEAGASRARPITQQTLRGYKSFFEIIAREDRPRPLRDRMNVRLEVTFREGARTYGASGG